jgi:hypothetical protein
MVEEESKEEEKEQDNGAEKKSSDTDWKTDYKPEAGVINFYQVSRPIREEEVESVCAQGATDWQKKKKHIWRMYSTAMR